jgi:hypothetical protein
MFRSRFSFYGEVLLAPRPTPKLEDHPLSSVCGSLFNVFAVSIRDPRTRHAVVTGTHQTWSVSLIGQFYFLLVHISSFTIGVLDSS